jgi:hypothetical protein
MSLSDFEEIASRRGTSSNYKRAKDQAEFVTLRGVAFRATSWLANFAIAQIKCAISCGANCSRVALAFEDSAAIKGAFAMDRAANDQAIVAIFYGENDDEGRLRLAGAAIASIRGQDGHTQTAKAHDK